MQLPAQCRQRGCRAELVQEFGYFPVDDRALAPPPVAGGERGGIDGAGEEAPAERRVGDKPCSELAGDVRDGGLLATPRS